MTYKYSSSSVVLEKWKCFIYIRFAILKNKVYIRFAILKNKIYIRFAILQNKTALFNILISPISYFRILTWKQLLRTEQCWQDPEDIRIYFNTDEFQSCYLFFFLVESLNDWSVKYLLLLQIPSKADIYLKSSDKRVSQQYRY